MIAAAVVVGVADTAIVALVALAGVCAATALLLHAFAEAVRAYRRCVEETRKTLRERAIWITWRQTRRHSLDTRQAVGWPGLDLRNHDERRKTHMAVIPERRSGIDRRAA